MNIAARISELLFEYECVVLPDFGGFISNDKPAHLNRMAHHFKPPYRELLFNVQLTANDGLLIKHIAETETVSYKEAKQKVAQFVAYCRGELASGNEIQLAQIGKLYFDDLQNIVFEQDQQLNYNPDSFGLNSLVSPVIKRTSPEEKIKGLIRSAPKVRKRTDIKPEQDTERRTQKTRKAIYPFPLAIGSLLLAVVVITSVFMTRQSSFVSLAGLFPSPSEQVIEEKTDIQKNHTHEVTEKLPANNMQHESVEQEVTAESDADKRISPIEETVDRSEEVMLASEESLIAGVTQGENPPDVMELEAEVAPAVANNTPGTEAIASPYYIIAGSFSKVENAQKMVQQLIEKGYSAVVADTNQNGMYRVAYAGFTNWATAKQELLAIRQGENTDAWVLKK